MRRSRMRTRSLDRIAPFGRALLALLGTMADRFAVGEADPLEIFARHFIAERLIGLERACESRALAIERILAALLHLGPALLAGIVLVERSRRRRRRRELDRAVRIEELRRAARAAVADPRTHRVR